MLRVWARALLDRLLTLHLLPLLLELLASEIEISLPRLEMLCLLLKVGDSIVRGQIWWRHIRAVNTDWFSGDVEALTLHVEDLYFESTPKSNLRKVHTKAMLVLVATERTTPQGSLMLISCSSLYSWKMEAMSGSHRGDPGMCTRNRELAANPP